MGTAFLRIPDALVASVLAERVAKALKDVREDKAEVVAVGQCVELWAVMSKALYSDVYIHATDEC